MQEYSSMTLEDWVATHASEEELRSIFLNMDSALKYIHEHGYCIEEFYPTEIQVLNNEDDYIQFKKLLKMPLDDALCKKIIQEDIFRSSLIQIGIYAKCLKYLKPNFLVENLILLPNLFLMMMFLIIGELFKEVLLFIFVSMI